MFRSRLRTIGAGAAGILSVLAVLAFQPALVNGAQSLLLSAGQSVTVGCQDGNAHATQPDTHTVSVLCAALERTPTPTLPTPNGTPATVPGGSSPVIAGIQWDSASLFQAAFSAQCNDGSDFWPFAWAADGNLYFAWGDGGGFGYSACSGSNNPAGTPNLGDKVAAGIGMVSGSPTFTGNGVTGLNLCSNMVNIDGGAQCGNPSPSTWPYTGGGGQKIVSLGSVDGTLYGMISVAVPNTYALTSSKDGHTWTQAPWSWDATGPVPYTFIDGGKDRSGLLPSNDGYVYLVGYNASGAWPGAALMRAPKALLATQSAYQFFAGMDSAGNPTWSTRAAAKPLALAGGTYFPGLHRWLLLSTGATAVNASGDLIGGMSQLDVYDAPNPWGPWTVVQLNTNWLNSAATSQTSGLLGMALVPKWTSTDGTDTWMVFSTFDPQRTDPFGDRFNLIHAKLQLRSQSPTPTPIATDTPKPTAPPTAQPPITVVPANTSTPIPTMSMPMPTPTTGTPPALDGATGNSAAFGIWTPTAWDTCTKAEHDSFYVVGPDGLRYPTWHPPTLTRTNGSVCTFGHEHGDDPRSTAEWTIVQRRYAHKLSDGSLDLAHAGIPFGYANSEMDAWETATGNQAMAMRHEDHVGQKIAAASKLQIGLSKAPDQPQFFYPGVTCDYIINVHQGTHSKDATENNLHEILYNVDCSDGHGIHEDVMAEFGQVGEFTRSCQPEGDDITPILTGTDFASALFPGTRKDGARKLEDRECLTTNFLVPPGSFSPNPYESWPVTISITKPNGSPVVDGLNLLFDVENPARYYWQGHASIAGGPVDNLGHLIDICYETNGNRQFRGILCDLSTNYGQWKNVTWDSPLSQFSGTNRGTYYKPGVTHNASGPTTWYTDPFGHNASTTPFPGAVAQLVSPDDTNYSAQVGAFETATSVNIDHSAQGVHAPN